VADDIGEEVVLAGLGARTPIRGRVSLKCCPSVLRALLSKALVRAN